MAHAHQCTIHGSCRDIHPCMLRWLYIYYIEDFIIVINDQRRSIRILLTAMIIAARRRYWHAAGQAIGPPFQAIGPPLHMLFF